MRVHQSTSPKHFLTLKDYNSDEIRDILHLAKEIKSHPEKFTKKLEGKTLALLFQKTSTRTRMSFEAGMIQLGGHAIYLDWRTTNLTLGAIEDEINCMARYVDVIMARVYEHTDLELMAGASRVPIINGLSDHFHPCQTLADLLLIEELIGEFSTNSKENIKISFIGDGSNNVASSLIIGAAKLGFEINVATPHQYAVREDVKIYLEENKLSGYFNEFRDPIAAVSGVDVIYTDTWVSMGQEDEKKRRLEIFGEFQVNSNLIGASSDSGDSGHKTFIMHCLPAHRDYEITSEVLGMPNCVVFDQAENRMHAQKALLLKLLSPEYMGHQSRL